MTLSDSKIPEWPIEIIRSDKRRKTVNAEVRNGVLIIQAPAAIKDEELAPIIEKLQQRLQRHSQPRSQTDEDLEKRAAELNKTYFKGELRWQSIRYVTNQNTRYGSCTPATGTIRLNHRLASLPAWVRDYVLMHELAHLKEANHSPRFWKLVNRYPLTERARGYLMALAFEEDTV